MQGGVSCFSIGFDVDEQRQRPPFIEDPAILVSDPFAQHIKIQRRERSFGPQSGYIVGHEQLPLNEEDIRFDARETVAQRIEKRALMEIVVMGMSRRQRLDSFRRIFRTCAPSRPECRQEQNQPSHPRQANRGSSVVGHGALC